MIRVDGEEVFSVAGMAAEDYFGGAPSYRSGTFYAPFVGNPLQHPNAPHKKGARWTVYRYLMLDSVPFQKSIRTEFEVIKDCTRR